MWIPCECCVDIRGHSVSSKEIGIISATQTHNLAHHLFQQASISVNLCVYVRMLVKASERAGERERGGVHRFEPKCVVYTLYHGVDNKHFSIPNLKRHIFIFFYFMHVCVWVFPCRFVCLFVFFSCCCCSCSLLHSSSPAHRHLHHHHRRRLMLWSKHEQKKLCALFTFFESSCVLNECEHTYT